MTCPALTSFVAIRPLLFVSWRNTPTLVLGSSGSPKPLAPLAVNHRSNCCSRNSSVAVDARH